MTIEAASPQEPTNADILAALGELSARLDKAFEQIDNIAGEIKPIVEKLSNSPILKMLGGR